ncbi:matrix metalloproteinase-19-like [Ruditapes philippinarum]|uniref:matrix metalloproteinase-19-like n=1 Tax=Ruditapes philippinarum TaxID=129788 RepID=UPI00295B6DFD|nr:matrix metalloproteinase-19-like [Ruditapes philippinarum]
MKQFGKYLFILIFYYFGDLSYGKPFDTDLYLEKFGYLDEKQPGKQHDEQSRKNAIETFQEFAGLPVTGQLNEATLKKMLAPRCGLPDVIKPSDRIPPTGNKKHDLRQPLQFNAPGYKWDKKQVTYKFAGFTRQLPASSQRRAIRNAFSKWEAVIPLTFREVSSGNADILINWVYRSHGDGSPFDGLGGTLAHAFFPGESDISGDTHFDDQEVWTERSKEGTNLEIVAAHELGHAIGLGHSNVDGALMLPFYGGYDPNYKLNYDDIRGAQSLYGGKQAPRPTPRPRPPPRPTLRPRPTSRPRPPTRRPAPTQKPDDEDKCSIKFDDIANGPDGRLYAFRYRKVYKFNSNDVGIERKFPRNVRKVFPKAPNNIGAAVYDRFNRKFYIFKGSRYWRYSYNFQLDPGYPKRLRGWYRSIQAALQEDNGEIRVLKGSEMSVWREDFTNPPRGYPVNINRGWPGLRSDLEAAIRYRRQSYFFKGGNYFRYNDRYKKVDYRKAKAGPWLGCGRVEPK